MNELEDGSTTATVFSPYRQQLDAIITRFDLPEDALVIVTGQTIREYCSSQLGQPDLELSETRSAKCITTAAGPKFLLWDHTDQASAMVPIVMRFPCEYIDQIEAPDAFASHLLLHEIAHYLRFDLHQGRPPGEIERDCDAWAFEQLRAGQPEA